jgi:hypothetical protein
MQEITLTLTVEEANAVLAALGQLPTSTGVFPLLKKIKEQGDAQVPPAPAEEAETTKEA